MSSGGGVRKNTLSIGLKQVVERYPKILGKGLRTETEIEATESRRITPVGETGNLRASVHAEGPFQQGRRIYCTIVAGGAAAAYAEYVHEDPDALHKPPTQWKFIESVILQSAAYMLTRVAKRVQLSEALS